MQLARLARVALVACVVVLVLSVSRDAFASDGGGHDSSSLTLPLSVVAMALAALNGIYALILRTRMVDREKLATVERGLTAVREQLKHVPKTDAMGEIASGLREQKATLEAIEKELGSMARRFERYEEHMLSREA